jgi:transcription-repair coupling factor (superfamily II helicase)
MKPIDSSSVFTLHSNTLIQPAFNRRFDLLIQDLKNWEQKGFEVYLFAENPKQLERLRIIFEDLKSDIVFNPVTVSIHFRVY